MLLLTFPNVSACKNCQRNGKLCKNIPGQDVEAFAVLLLAVCDCDFLRVKWEHHSLGLSVCLTNLLTKVATMINRRPADVVISASFVFSASWWWWEARNTSTEFWSLKLSLELQGSSSFVSPTSVCVNRTGWIKGCTEHDCSGRRTFYRQSFSEVNSNEKIFNHFQSVFDGFTRVPVGARLLNHCPTLDHCS